MSSFIKTLESEYERDKKIADERKYLNEMFDIEQAQRRNKIKAELQRTKLDNFQTSIEKGKLRNKMLWYDRNVPHFEGDLGYPQCPQLTIEEQKRLK